VKVIRVGESPEARLMLPEMETTEFGVEADRSCDADECPGDKETETALVPIDPLCHE
jgi:hypothetical protein